MTVYNTRNYKTASKEKNVDCKQPELSWRREAESLRPPKMDE